MVTIKRLLKIDLPARQSAFLWGPRKTGKSTFLKMNFPHSRVYDFLQTEVFLELTKRPSLLREQLLAANPKELKVPVILDEVQKVPQLMDEVHWLIENKGLRFILCGSSARKLKRGLSNMLGGRAWRYEMFPLVTPELGEIDLLRALNHGLVPAHYLQQDYKKSLRAYVLDYLKEEIFDEGLTRNLPAFSRFFEAMGFSHGQLTNFSNIARDCGVDSKTVKEYYQILVDTLLGRFLLPFKKRQARQVIGTTPKFYLFDVGVAGAIVGRRIYQERGEQFGGALEHFILMEIVAYNAMRELDFDVSFWRTKTGLEVDFVLGSGEVAIEVKGASRIDKNDVRPLQAFVEEFSPRLALVVCNEKSARVYEGVKIMPWREFLAELWLGKIIR